jgi:hypothetical protein
MITEITEMTKPPLCKYNRENGEPDAHLTLDHI